MNPLYRRVIAGALEDDAALDVTEAGGEALPDNGGVHAFEGDRAGGVRFRRRVNPEETATLTVALTFAKDMETARDTWRTAAAGDHSPEAVQQKWRAWFEGGAVVTTGNDALDKAYRVQTMYLKLSQDAELGGMIVGGRYQVTTVWTRDSGVGISSLLDAGHYEESRLGLAFYRDHAAWNVRNNCLHANYHASGKVHFGLCGPTQTAVEEVVHPFQRIPEKPAEWTIQMVGPQLDGMAYFLYNMGKYQRLSGDMQFVRDSWPFIMQVADALAADSSVFAEVPAEGNAFFDTYRRYQKYHPETGLIIDMCYEDGGYREHLLMNGLAVAGFLEAHRLSELMGGPVSLWKERADRLDSAIREHLVRADEGGNRRLMEWVPRPWLSDGQEIVLAVRGSGYPWSIAATVPWLNWRDPLLSDAFGQVPADHEIGGWGMWWATLAHAAYEAGDPEKGWHYLRQLLGKLPHSGQMYEHNQLVYGEDGSVRRATQNLFGYAYLPHALIRGLAGFGYDTRRGDCFFRPQVPQELGVMHSRVRVGETWFSVRAEGQGSRVARYTIDGEPVTTDGSIPEKYFDGGEHSVEIVMQAE